MGLKSNCRSDLPGGFAAMMSGRALPFRTVSTVLGGSASAQRGGSWCGKAKPFRSSVRRAAMHGTKDYFLRALRLSVLTLLSIQSSAAR
jgi:hypothetical protein